MSDMKMSRRGVYYDLTISPYEYQSPYGDIFKFSSQKKLDMFTRDLPKEMDRLEKLIERYDLSSYLPDEIIQLLFKSVYRSFYRKIEG